MSEIDLVVKAAKFAYEMPIVHNLLHETVEHSISLLGRATKPLETLVEHTSLKFTMDSITPAKELLPFTGEHALKSSVDLSKAKFPMTLQGADITYPVGVDGEMRAATVHLPPGFNPEKSRSVFFLADGAQYKDPAGEMLDGYGWRKTSDDNSFVSVALAQSPKSQVEISESKLLRLFPKNSMWRTPHSFLNPSNQVDDMSYFQKVQQGVQQAMTVDADKINFVGFCDGGVYGHALASKFKFNGLATICSTTIKDVSPKPVEGIKGYFVTAEDDKIIPQSGGAGKSFGRYIKMLGHENISNSQPLAQAPESATVNHLLSGAESQIEEGTQRLWRTHDGSTRTTEISLKSNGHNWPGTTYTVASQETVKSVSPARTLRFNQDIVNAFQ